MVSEWKCAPLADCMEAIIDYRGKTPKKVSSGVPLITAKIIKNGMITSYDEYIAEDDYVPWMRRGIPFPGDIVMTVEAPLGEVAQLDETRVALAQRVITLRGKKGVLDNTYLKHQLLSDYVQDQLRSRATGTTVLGIKQSELRKISLLLPPISEQRAIAHILGTLDDKIELNRRMNETLEAMARAIFKSWFVDFDPVRTKAAGQKPVSLAPHIADLFPDSFEDSALGEIPKGWKEYALPDLIQVNPTRSLTKGLLAPYLDMSSMPTQGPSPSSWVIREMGSGMKFINGDTLVARITPCLENGKTAFVDFLLEGEVGWGSTEYIVLRPKGSIPPIFAYLLARTDDFRAFAIQQMTGSSGRQRVPAGSLSKYSVIAPDMESPLFEHFGKLVE